jgi:hypothetical protein
MKEKKMKSFHENMNEYRKQLEKGAIQKAYKGLMEYMLDLRNHFRKNFPDYYPSGVMYFGFMDMTYFPLFPESLKQRSLKIAIVFAHEAFRFEVWLSGANKQVQAKYWKLFKESSWNKYHLVETTKGADSILEYVLVDAPDFNDLEALTKQIESGTLKFIKDIENFLNR